MEPEFRKDLGDVTGRFIRRKHGWLEYRYTPGGGCEIVNIEVVGKHRRTGIGTSMLQELEALPDVHVVYAFTRWTNRLGINWYVKNGFSLTLVPFFYGRARDGHAFIAIKQVK